MNGESCLQREFHSRILRVSDSRDLRARVGDGDSAVLEKHRVGFESVFQEEKSVKVGGPWIK